MLVKIFYHKDGRKFELHTNEFKSLWWEIENQNIPHCINTSPSSINDSVKEGILSTKDIYHVFYICYCKECKGKYISHSQGAWDEHLRYINNEDIISIPTGE